MEINYQKLGSGKNNIVVLHGWGGSLNSLAGLSKDMSDSYTVWNIELPGFGANPIKIVPNEFTEYVEMLHKFIAEHITTKYFLFGHSFGGACAAYIATHYPTEVAALILCNASGIRVNSSKKRVWQSLAQISHKFMQIIPQFISQPARKFFYYYILRERDYINSNYLKQLYLDVINTDIQSIYQQIKLPTLLIWGERDTYTPLWMGRKLNQLIANSQLEIVADATHGLPLKQPHLVARKVTTFLSQLPQQQ